MHQSKTSAVGGTSVKKILAYIFTLYARSNFCLPRHHNDLWYESQSKLWKYIPQQAAVH
jgi:hypothetical protein